MEDLRDDPIIERTERTGLAPWQKDWPVCPLCRAEASVFYVIDDEVIGCDVCVEEKDAWDWKADHHD